MTTHDDLLARLDSVNAPSFGYIEQTKKDAAAAIRSLQGQLEAEIVRHHETGAVLYEKIGELEAERKAREEAERLVYVPGVLKCAKCGCVLVTTILDASSGRVAANNAPQECPNKCGPMWRRTERDAGNDLCGRLDKEHERAESAERRLAEVEQDAKRYRWLRNDNSKFGWQGKNGMTGEQIDVAIDAAIKESAIQEKGK